MALTGCSGNAADEGAAGFEELQSATIAITGEGAVVDPGATTPAVAPRVGSGFLVTADGLAVTGSDVVAGADALTVRVGGDESEQAGATVLGVSECLGIAVLQLDEGRYPFLAWRKGQTVAGLEVHFAGYPTDAGGEFTIDAGSVVSADAPLAAAWLSLARAIEHDALAGAGGSGAPVVDDEGRVAGVGRTGDDALDTDVAIPGGVVREALDRLAAGEPVSSIGVDARAWSSPDGAISGVWVQSVRPDGLAAAAGVVPGDLITKLAGRPVGADGTLADYCDVLAAVGDAALDIEVYRTANDELLAGRIGGAAVTSTSTAVYRRSGTFATVGDTAGLVRVDVPAEWGQVDGAGFTDSSGNQWYSVTAAPNLEQYRGGLTEPGVQVAVTAAGGSVGELLTGLSGSYDASCSPIDQFQPYDDGVFTGAYSRWMCEGTLAMVVSARTVRGNNVALITQVRSPIDQQQTLQRMLSTFAVGR